MAFHASARGGYAWTIGEAGVDLFFVLSGFLMVVITTAQTRPLAFLGDRIRRIVPPYWIATSVMLLGALAGLFPGVRLTLDHVLASYLFVPARSPSSLLIWPLLVQGWTLNMEMFFYAVFAGLIAIAGRRWQLPLLTAILAGLVVIGLIVAPRDAIGVTYTDPMLLEFAAGGWLGLAWKRFGAPVRALGVPLLILAAALLVASGWLELAQPRALLFGVPALLMVAGVLACEHRDGGVPRWRLPVLIGDASYSIYLWHTFAISVVHALATRLGLPPVADIAGGFVGGVVLGVVAYATTERPLLRMMKRRRSRHGVPIPAGL